MFAPTVGASSTRALRRPGLARCPGEIVAVIGRFCPGLVAPGPPSETLRLGENGSAAQLVDV